MLKKISSLFFHYIHYVRHVCHQFLKQLFAIWKCCVFIYIIYVFWKITLLRFKANVMRLNNICKCQTNVIEKYTFFRYIYTLHFIDVHRMPLVLTAYSRCTSNVVEKSTFVRYIYTLHLLDAHRMSLVLTAFSRCTWNVIKKCKPKMYIFKKGEMYIWNVAFLTTFHMCISNVGKNVDFFSPDIEQSNSRTLEHSNSRTVEQSNSRTLEH